MKNLLFIAYYFPPLGMGGVQRAVKFVKYLPEFGWRPFVLTVEEMPYYAKDASLLEEIGETEIARTFSLDPPHLLGKFQSGKGTATGQETFGARFIRGLSSFLCIPDNKILWVPYAFRRAVEMMKTHRYRAVLTTSPPHSSHLLGYLLKRQYRIPWIADFRDNWFDDYYRRGITPVHTAANRRIAACFIKQADALIGVSDHISRALQNHGAGQVHTIYNGFDREDFRITRQTEPDRRFTITYAGTLNRWLNPEAFLQGVSMAVHRNPGLREDLRVEFIGTPIGINVPEMAEKAQIRDLTAFLGYLGHRACLKRVLASDMLLLLIPQTLSRGMITGKLFEYLAAHKPILALVPPGEARELLLALGHGVALHPGDSEGIASELIRAHELWKRGDLRLQQKQWTTLKRYERREQAKVLAEILNGTLADRQRGPDLPLKG